MSPDNPTTDNQGIYVEPDWSLLLPEWFSSKIPTRVYDYVSIESSQGQGQNTVAYYETGFTDISALWFLFFTFVVFQLFFFLIRKI